MEQIFDVPFEDYIIFHRGVANTYIDDNKDLHIVYQDGADQNIGNPYGDYVGTATQAAEDSCDCADAAKRWAVGQNRDGEPVPESDETYHNNSKHYAEIAAKAEEYTYGTKDGTEIAERAENNAKYFYEQIVAAESAFLSWNDAAELLHFTGETSTGPLEQIKNVTLIQSEDDPALTAFSLKNGIHLSTEFIYDNGCSDVYLNINNYTVPVIFKGTANFDKLCGTCEFILRKTTINNEVSYFWEFLHSNKYEPIIYAEYDLPATGKRGQICILKKESEE